MKDYFLRFISLLCLLSVLAGCGGGGGSSANGSSSSQGTGLSLSTHSLGFSAKSGDLLPASQVVTVTSAASDAYKVVAGVPIGQSIPSWLSLSFDSPMQLRVSVVATDIQTGTYSQTLRIALARSDDTLIAYQDVSVTYIISNSLLASPQSLSFDQFVGDPAPPAQILNLTDHGSSSYPWTVQTTYNGGNGWLTVDPATGTALPASTSVGINGAEVPGTYTGTITITGANDSISIPVTYNLRIAQLAVNTTKLIFLAGNRQLHLPPAQTVILSTENGKDVPFTTSIDYGSGASGWLSLSGQTAPGVLSIVLNTVDLPEGDYAATVVLSPSNGAAPVNVDIAYQVHSTPIQLTDVQMPLTATSGAADDPSTSIAVTTDADSHVDYDVAITYSSPSLDWLTASLGAAPGTILISATTTDLVPGTYFAVVTLMPDSGAVPTAVQIAYTLTAPSFSANTLSVNFTLDSSSKPTSVNLSRSILTSSNGGTIPWSAVTSANWLTVTPAGNSGDSAVVAVVPSQLNNLQNGTQSATVTFTYGGFSPGSVSVPVTLDLDVAAVNFVAPYVGYVNEQKQFIVRGSGFSQANLSQLMFDNTPVTTFSIKSDTELLVTPPLYSIAGRYSVGFSNQLGLTEKRADFVVRTKPTYSYATMPAPAYVFQHVIYDAERDAVIASASTGTSRSIVRFSHDNSNDTWTSTSVSFDDSLDIGITPDGKHLVVLTNNNLLLLDPVSLETKETIPLPTTVQRKIAVTNDGQVYILDLNQTYSVVTKSFRPITFPNYDHLYDIYASPDGSRLVMGGQTSVVGLYYYDASADMIVNTGMGIQFSGAWFDRDATKTGVGNVVFDSDFHQLGSIKCAAAYGGTTMNQVGTRIYSYDECNSTYNTVRVWDISTAQDVYPELTPIVLPDSAGVFPVLRLSTDDRTLFLIGNSLLIVQPLP